MDERIPTIPRLRQSRSCGARCLNVVEQPAQNGRVDGVNEAVLPVAPPIDQVAGAPAGLALDAVLEVDDDLKLAVRADARLVNAGRTDMPEPLFGDGVLVRQRLRPEHVDMRSLGGLIGKLSQACIPTLGAGAAARVRSIARCGRENVTRIQRPPGFSGRCRRRRFTKSSPTAQKQSTHPGRNQQKQPDPTRPAR